MWEDVCSLDLARRESAAVWPLPGPKRQSDEVSSGVVEWARVGRTGVRNAWVCMLEMYGDDYDGRSGEGGREGWAGEGD